MDWIDIVLLALFALFYIFLTRKILPRMGVPT